MKDTSVDVDCTLVLQSLYCIIHIVLNYSHLLIYAKYLYLYSLYCKYLSTSLLIDPHQIMQSRCLSFINGSCKHS